MGSYICTRDSLGGACIDAIQGRAWKCPDNSFHHLDILNSAELEDLDLSLARPGLHLRVEGCPQLRSIRLPAGDPCIVHIAGNSEPQLSIIGPVCLIDACWGSEKLQVIAERDEPWSSTSVGAVADVMPADLVVLLGQSQESELQFDATGIQRLHWQGAKGLQALLFKSGTDDELRYLTLINAGDCKEIYGNQPLVRVDIHECPAMQTIYLDSQVIHLHGKVGFKDLRVPGKIGHLLVSNSRLRRLNCSRTAALSLIFCTRLISVGVQPGTAVTCQGRVPGNLSNQVKVVVNEATIEHAIVQLDQNNGEGLEELRCLLLQMHAPHQLIHAFGLLQRLIKRGVASVWLWEARLQLAWAHRRGKPSEVPAPMQQSERERFLSFWAWRLPDDRSEEVYLLDLTLCLHCAEIPECRSFFSVVAQGIAESTGRWCVERNKPPALDACLRQWLNQPGGLPTETIALTHACIHELRALHSADKPLKIEGHLGEWLYKCRSLLSMSGGTEYDALADAIWALLFDHLSLDNLLHLLRKELPQRPHSIRTQLIQLASLPHTHWQDRGSEEEIRHFPVRARALALSPTP